MIIYKWLPQNISHIWQLLKEEKEEYYEILNNLLIGYEKEFKDEIITWELELVFWLNNSFIPWWWKSQSIFRPHTHVIAIHKKPKVELDWSHKVEHIELNENNMWLLALNKQNLSMIRDFERYLPPELKELCNRSSIIESTDDYYSLDFSLPWNWEITDPKLIETFEKINNEWSSFLKHIYNTTWWIVSKETIHAIWQDINKIWFSIWCYKESWNWHLRLRFSFKNLWEDAWSLEALGHAIHRNDQETPQKPNQDRVRELVKRIFNVKNTKVII